MKRHGLGTPEVVSSDLELECPDYPIVQKTVEISHDISHCIYHINIYIYTHIHIHMYTVIHIHICIVIYIYICIVMHIYDYICICIYIYVCICIYIYIYVYVVKLSSYLWRLFSHHSHCRAPGSLKGGWAWSQGHGDG